MEERTVVSRRSRRRRRKRRGGCLKWFLCLLLILIVIVLGWGVKFYFDAKQASDAVYDPNLNNVTQVREEKVDLSTRKPFSILLLGIDTGEEGRTDTGRSDVIIVGVVNPQTKKTTMVSIPRDSYANIVGYGTQDKINHAYAFGGVSMSVNTIQEFLDIPIDYTITIDMKGFEEIIDAVGGISITSLATFTHYNYSFVEGQVYHMDGVMALSYIRDRSTDTGDYGRQERQRQVISTLVNEVLSLNLISNYQSILNSLTGTLTTNLSFSEIMNIAQNYGSSLTNINTLTLSGEGQMIDGVYYEMIDPSQLESVQSELRSELGLN